MEWSQVEVNAFLSKWVYFGQNISDKNFPVVGAKLSARKVETRDLPDLHLICEQFSHPF